MTPDVPPARPAATTAGLVVGAWVLILGALLLTGWLVTNPLSSGIEPWDDDLARSIADQRTATLTSAADIGTLLGDTPVGMGVAAVATLAIALWARSWRPAVFMGLVVAGLGGFYFVATHLITRDRPPVRILDPGLVPDHSFPSGHVATAIGVYAGLAVALAWQLRRTGRSTGWVWVLLLAPLAVLVARLYEGAHHLTDVLASVCYAGVWVLLLARLVLPASAEGGAGRATREEVRSSAR